VTPASPGGVSQRQQARGIPFGKTRIGVNTGDVMTLGLAVDDEVDVALPVQHHVLAAVPRHQGEAHFLEQGFKHPGHRGRKLDELEAAQAHGVVKQISHENLQKTIKRKPQTPQTPLNPASRWP
jgi:hypothetical protein